jgi:hypothetical protein
MHNYTPTSDDRLFSYIKEKASLLTGCCVCGLVWPLKRKLRELKSPEAFWELSSSIFKLNTKRLSVEQLRKMEMDISLSDMCPGCFPSEMPSYVEEVKKDQAARGYSPCFYSGHVSCDQSACEHRHICIRDENIPPTEEKYFTHLFETVFTPASMGTH